MKNKTAKSTKPHSDAIVIAELLDALQNVQKWNNGDIKGFDEITPNMEMLKARRTYLKNAIKKAGG